MKRANIIVKGRVQKVGYRDLVAEIANGLNIGGMVKNLPDRTVKIVAEAEKEILEKFIALIEPTDDPMIKVTDVDVKFEPATREFEYFDIEYEDFQQEGFERLGITAVYLKRIDKKHDQTINELRTFREESGEKQDQMLGKQDQMLGKQDQMLGKQDQMLGKQDQMLGKQDETVNILKQNNREMKEFRQDTMQRFDIIDTKYGKIAENMEMAIGAINRTCTNTERLLEKTERDRKDFRDAIEKLTNAIIEISKR